MELVYYDGDDDYDDDGNDNDLMMTKVIISTEQFADLLNGNS
jgi:hypothetical protein